MARLQAQKKNYNEAILVNTKGHIAEGSRSNIFLVKRGILYTPSLDSGCIPGIARGIILKLARQNHIRAVEAKIRIKDLLSADEAFISNSLMKIMPLVKVNGVSLSDARPGEMTQILLKRYREIAIRRREVSL